MNCCDPLGVYCFQGDMLIPSSNQIANTLSHYLRLLLFGLPLLSNGNICDDWHAVCANYIRQFQPLLPASEFIIGRFYPSLLQPLQCSMALPRINLLLVLKSYYLRDASHQSLAGLPFHTPPFSANTEN